MPIEAAFMAGKIGFVFSLVLSLAGLLGWVERKQSALMQDRIGANRADVLGFKIIGLFHPLADAIKGFTKEDFIPARANKILHTLAPVIALVPALTAFAVIPFGDTLTIGGSTTSLVIADLNVGVLFVSPSCRSPPSGSCWRAGPPTTTTRCSEGCAPRPRCFPTRS
jgi:NADH-quinone oxidoreductase subunit H